MQAGLVWKRLSFREIFMAGSRLILCVLMLAHVDVAPRQSRGASMAA